MEEIIYSELTPSNFHRNSLDSFIRHQEVKECWRIQNGMWVLIPHPFTEDWDLSELRELASEIEYRLTNGWSGFGAWQNRRLIGFGVLDERPLGSRNQYLDLVHFYVSEPYRGLGVGRRLFSMAAQKAREAGAEKLYISAHSSKESQKAYRRLGCKLAEEIDPVLAAKEPCDVQMEYLL